ncbi:hypothetical protein MATL_G00021270 [Megalops atlanticus]|uniref:Uncharacterized protein n=1 Tax=Megalops atlanticus TaxID=7932 RepID=A0A9D3QKY1_MEGAT|nr:hypothetical protein MATL_G00021270 [Megalops atlanticus]
MYLNLSRTGDVSTFQSTQIEDPPLPMWRFCQSPQPNRTPFYNDRSQSLRCFQFLQKMRLSCPEYMRRRRYPLVRINDCQASLQDLKSLCHPQNDFPWLTDAVVDARLAQLAAEAEDLTHLCLGGGSGINTAKLMSVSCLV